MAQRAHPAEPGEVFPETERTTRESVGQTLARARLGLGQELADVSTNLRIRRVYLLAIEEGRYAELPGATYAVGFVRSYADYLGLDSEFLVERFKQEIAGLGRRQQLHFPAPKPEGRIPGGALVLVSLLLIGIAYGVWSFATSNPDLLDGLLSSEPGVPTAAVPTAPQDPAADGSQQPADGAGVSEPARETAAGDVQVFTAPQETVETGPKSVVQRTPEPPVGAMPVEPAPQPEAETAQTAASSDGPAPSLAAPAQRPEVQGPGVQSPSVQSQPAPQVEAQAQVEAPQVQSAPPQIVPAPEVPAPATAETAAPAQAAVQTTQAPAAGAAASAAAETADVAPAQAATRAAAETPRQADGETAASDIAAASTEAVAADIPAAPEIPTQVAVATGRVYGAVNENSRITLTATADSWVQVRSADDNLLITRVLREGDIYRVPNQDGLVLETGNAGGLQVTVDGRNAPALGRPGDVVRGISLEPAALLAGQAPE